MKRESEIAKNRREKGKLLSKHFNRKLQIVNKFEFVTGPFTVGKNGFLFVDNEHTFYEVDVLQPIEELIKEVSEFIK